MNDSVFEWMEQVRLVDRALLIFALCVPVLTLAVAYLKRRSRMVNAYKHHWIMAGMTPCVVFLLWFLYNKVIDMWGLDTLVALAINICLFAGFAVALAVLWLWLERRFRPLPDKTSVPDGQDLGAGV